LIRRRSDDGGRFLGRGFGCWSRRLQIGDPRRHFDDRRTRGRDRLGLGFFDGGNVFGFRLNEGRQLFHCRRRLDLFGRREGVDLLLDLGKRSRLHGRRGGRGGSATLGDAPFERIDLIGFQTAELVLDVVAKVPAVIEDGLGFQPERFGQFKDADFLESLRSQAVLLRGVPHAPPPDVEASYG
jgi:hypothetical protein